MTSSRRTRPASSPSLDPHAMLTDTQTCLFPQMTSIAHSLETASRGELPRCASEGPGAGYCLKSRHHLPGTGLLWPGKPDYAYESWSRGHRSRMRDVLGTHTLAHTHTDITQRGRPFRTEIRAEVPGDGKERGRDVQTHSPLWLVLSRDYCLLSPFPPAWSRG